MDVIRDVLDKQVMDRHGRMMGKVDGIVMELGEAGGPPRLAFIEMGAITQARRLHRRLGKWVEALVLKVGAKKESECYRVPWSKVVPTGIDVTLNVEAESTPAFDFERWLRRQVIGRIPGA